ncbi:putative aminopeptidase npepl1 [Perkinsus chesapeaki]|uniref:Putative aminopeptidase npepl1 n=1 Tax=Perkinsus chesapeaki TaxID=330153 RepID=A0A7J6L1H7_PERCH|nr:putative aminopeptidase npepl1 [Perkinsus chesapeaki]
MPKQKATEATGETSAAKRPRVIENVDELLWKGYGQQLVFGNAVHLESSKSIFLVGQLKALEAFAKKPAGSVPESVVERVNTFIRMKSGSDSPATPSQTVEYLVDGGQLRKVVIVCVPHEASRNNNVIRHQFLHQDRRSVVPGKSFISTNKEKDPARPDAVARALVKFPEFTGMDDNPITVLALGSMSSDAAATGLAVARASHKLNFSSKRAKKLTELAKSNIVVWSGDGEKVDVGRLSVVAENIRRAALLTELPANLLNTRTYLKAIKDIVGELRGKGRIEVKVIEGEELEEQGFGGMWNVGKASPGDKSIALVGKGIVYDTGGLAIKTKDGMMGMKSDMGGSAGLLGAFAALVETEKLKKPLHFIGCLAENSIGPESYRQGDVITLYSGLTVEVNNTDCEGRLVLADGVAYAAKHLDPEMIIDMATLTYAQSVVTGSSHAAIFSNCESLEKDAVDAGKTSGDLVYPVLFCPEVHKAQLRSDIADLKNQPTPGAGCSCAGSFIYENLIAAAGNDDIKFLHVDMASFSTNLDGRASGFGVALVHQLLKNDA